LLCPFPPRSPPDLAAQPAERGEGGGAPPRGALRGTGVRALDQLTV